MNRLTLWIAGAFLSLGAHATEARKEPSLAEQVTQYTYTKVHGLKENFVMVIPPENAGNPHIVDCDTVTPTTQNVVLVELNGCQLRNSLPTLMPTETVALRIGNETGVSMKFNNPRTGAAIRVILPKSAEPAHVQKFNQLRQTVNTHITKSRGK